MRHECTACKKQSIILKYNKWCPICFEKIRIDLITDRIKEELEKLRREMKEPDCRGHLASLTSGEFDGLKKALEIIEEMQ